MELYKKIDGRTKLYGLVGNPVEHSLSPIIQNSVYEKLKINSKYVTFKIDKNNISKMLSTMKILNISGINVTYPYKKEILSMCDVISEECKILESSNTIHLVNDKTYCYSTDGIGFLKGFTSEFNIEIKNKRVLLIGFGGAGRSIALTLLKNNIEKLYINNRTNEKIKSFKNKIDKNMSNKIEIVDSISSIKADIIINSTSIGFIKDEIHPILSDYNFNENQYVVDIIYNPKETQLLKKAKRQGSKIQNGLSMLVFQALESISIWNGISIESSIGKEIVELISEI